jgi:DNA-binding MarR family transcriptional regulator
MNVESTLETLRSHPDSQEQLRLAALDLGGALASLSDKELVLLDTGLARLRASQPEAAPWLQGFWSALSAVLSGQHQQRQQEREQRVQEQELEEQQRALRPDCRRLMVVMGTGLIRPGELERAARMSASQVSRNISGMVKVGYLERVPVGEMSEELAQDGRARLYRLTPEGLRLRARILQRAAVSPPPPPSDASSSAEASRVVRRKMAKFPRSIRDLLRQRRRTLLLRSTPVHIQITHLPATGGNAYNVVQEVALQNEPQTSLHLGYRSGSVGTVKIQDALMGLQPPARSDDSGSLERSKLVRGA